MRILCLCAAGRFYGRENVTLSLLNGLSDRGHEVLCLSSSWNDGEFERRLTESSIPYKAIPLGFISKTLSPSALRMTAVQGMRIPELWVKYGNTIKSFKPDVVVHSNLHHLALLLPVLGKQINIFHLHDAFAPTDFHRRLFERFNRRVEAFVAVSKFIAENLKDLGVPANKIKCVPNGVIAGQNGTRNQRLISGQSRNGSLRIGIVGQVAEWKGHEDLVEAVALLNNTDSAFVVRVFGDGSPQFTSSLKSRITRLGLENKFEWMGFVADQHSIYQDMDVCVVPSRFSEPFGLVAAEALHHGIPVIASCKGALPEIVQDGETGYVIEARAPEQLAAKLADLANSSDKRLHLGEAARRYATTFLSADTMVVGFESLMTQLTDGAVL